MPWSTTNSIVCHSTIPLNVKGVSIISIFFQICCNTAFSIICGNIPRVCFCPFFRYDFIFLSRFFPFLLILLHRFLLCLRGVRPLRRECRHRNHACRYGQRKCLRIIIFLHIFPSLLSVLSLYPMRINSFFLHKQKKAPPLSGNARFFAAGYQLKGPVALRHRLSPTLPNYACFLRNLLFYAI